MTRGLRVLLVVLVLVALPGCDGDDILAQVAGLNADIALVAQGMAARGWGGFPGSAVDLYRYGDDLRDAIRDAKRGPVTTAVPRGVRRTSPEPWAPKPLGEAFGVPGGER